MDNDTDRLNYLEVLFYHSKFDIVLRNSTTDRGMRLHNTSKGKGHGSVRDAIDDFYKNDT